MLSLALALTAALQEEPPLLLQEDFEKGAERWEPTDPKRWRIADAPGGGKLFALHDKASDYKPPFRSPFNFALARELVVGDFVLETRVRSTVKDYNHRDVVLVFGYQDPSHFYYSHLGKQTDDHANQIFIVNGAARTKISTRTSAGTPWTDDWHRVRVVRRAAEGAVEVYFDDLKSPAQTASDKTFAWGRVGIGSFDDTAEWDDLTLRGTKVAPPK